jgi:hypothetical protein
MGEKYFSFHLVRLTPNEMNMIQKKHIGDKFFHINLQHSGAPVNWMVNQKLLAIKIKRHGIENDKQKIAPNLDINYRVLLELINIEVNIPISSLKDPNPNFILENSNGLYSSLCDRYCHVRNLTPQQILSMNCFISQFKILDFHPQI